VKGGFSQITVLKLVGWKTQAEETFLHTGALFIGKKANTV
jgi:hypothetical protein